jgi:hypothetical protein
VEGQTDQVALEEAARRLGITVAGVKNRLQRDQLQGVKIDGRWRLVFLNGDSTATTDPDLARTSDSRPSLSWDTSETVRDAYERLVAAKDAELARLTDQLQFLQRELESRKDHILAALAARLPELTAPASQPEPTAPAEPPRRPWWRWWG